MPVDQLATVACAIVVLRILYALPSWGGFLSTDLTNRIDAFSGDLDVLAILIGLSVYVTCCITMIYSCLPKCALPGHSLYHLLPPQRICTNLHSRVHTFQLPDCIKDPSLFIRCLNLFNFIELLSSYAVSLF